MTCALCSAAVFGPLVQGGVSIAKIAERAKRAVAALDGACEDGVALREAKAAVSALADTANLLAAEAAEREK